MLLSQRAFERARRFLETHARPLEVARFRCLFAGGRASDVLFELARYQNADGGLGRALEPDCRGPASSALCTTVALQVLREIGFTGPSDLIAAATEYLVRTCDRGQLAWRMVPYAAEAIPQAPWWNSAAAEKTIEFALNPTAEILGYLYEQQALVPPDLLAALSERIIAHLAGQSRIIMHDYLCCMRLAETAHLPERLRAPLVRELLRLLPTAVATDPAQWAAYSLRPLQAVPGPHSPFYPPLREAIAANLDYELATQQEDGSWPLTWSWAEAYPEAWQRAAVEWSGVITVERLLSLKRYGRIEGLAPQP